jgi:hypothetical protein
MSCASNSGIIKATSIPQVCANSSTLTDVLNVIFVLIGAISLLVVVIGGFRYIRAGSNDTIIAESKRMIAHALVGVIVAASAAAIVNFVLVRV